jgi:hypothetical protein
MVRRRRADPEGGRARGGDALAPNVMTSETIRKISDHQAMMINKSACGMLVLGDDTLYTLEVNRRSTS